MTETVDFNRVSMLDRIKSANDVEEIQSLIQEGGTYQYASDKIRKRWFKAADLRKNELSNDKKKPKPKTDGTKHKKSTKKRKGK